MQRSGELLRSRFPTLAESPDTAIEKFFGQSRIATIPAGHPIFHAGDACDNFLLLLEGEIRVQLTSATGREVTLYRIRPGGSCILTTSCLLGNDHYPAAAVAESQVTAALVSSTDFKQALRDSDSFREFVFDGFAHRLSRVIERIEEIAFASIDSRLALALLNAATTERLTHQQLAVEIGTAREVVSRHLKHFESRGWVSLGRGKVDIRDAGSLQRVAAGSESD